MKWARKNEGYFQIDHRASPGTQQVPGGSNFEAPTATCCHCNTPFVIVNRIKVHWCRRCMDYVCDSPSCHECKPFNKKLDDELDDIHRLIQAGKV